MAETQLISKKLDDEMHWQHIQSSGSVEGMHLSTVGFCSNILSYIDQLLAGHANPLLPSTMTY